MASLLLVLGLGACAQPMVPPDGPLLGRWQGAQTGPVITTLTLYGRLQDGGGAYEITTLDHYVSLSPAAGSKFTTWGGRWDLRTTLADGHVRRTIRLEHALNTEIDRYILDDAGILEPTSYLVGRPLSKQEISVYSLYPIRTG